MQNKSIIYFVLGLLVIFLSIFIFKSISSDKNSLETDYPKTDSEADSSIPNHLLKLFPDTNWNLFDPKLASALSGGPTKDGIPALDNPKFIPVDKSDYPDEVQTIVVTGKTETKIYPYSILIWHEIVNDVIDETPVSVTFCPLCGSAVVYNRTLPDGTVTTFGVSGSLLESNMIMYDRATENLWQQSTGKVLAGSFFPSQLDLVSFQLITFKEAKTLYSNAKVLSKDTGYNRNYDRNPYSGYDNDDNFIFEPSNVDATFPPKTIMAVFRALDETPIAVPWLALKEAGEVTEKINNVSYTLSVNDGGELTISDENSLVYPFYFEMWFSFAVQHGDNLTIIYP